TTTPCENEMSDTFWVQLALIVLYLAKEWFNERREKRVAEERRLLKEELHANTVATLQGNEEVTSKLDSATRETTTNAADAKKAATFAAARSVVIEKKADMIEKTANKIEERLNGGELGLGNRVAKNETRLESLEQGQAAIAKLVENQGRGLEAVARSVDNLVLNFGAFSDQYKKNHENDPGAGH